MHRYAVFLRGINVGRAQRIAMADLRAALERDGYSDVRTLLNSGNVVLSGERSPSDTARAVEELLRRTFSMPIGVVVRTRDEIAALVDAAPLADVATDGSRTVVYFLSEPAPAATLEELLAVDHAEDVLRASTDRRELYVWCPNGQTDSQLVTAVTRARLPGVLTARNWNTVVKLLALLDRD